MRYLLLLTHDPHAPEPADDGHAGTADGWIAMTAELRDAGVMIDGDALHADDTATTVRVRDGRRLVTDGPYTETKEMLIGYYLIDVEDLDAALRWAARMPNVVQGAVEVRPVMPGPASGGAAPASGPGVSGS